MQTTFEDIARNGVKKETKKERFLREMNAIVPWKEFEKILNKAYLKTSAVGRPQHQLNVMLRMYFIQIWYSLSDPDTEDALIENYSIRKFVGVGVDNVPDETALCRFRHFLEQNNFQKKLFDLTQNLFEQKGVSVSNGKMLDATIYHSPMSKRNAQGKRLTEASWTKKAGNYHFGEKSHIAVDTKTKLVIKHKTTLANVHDSTVADELIDNNTTEVHADSGYLGIDKKSTRHIKYNIALRPSSVAKTKCPILQELVHEQEYQKAKVRCRVEHIFLVIKHLFKHRKTRYRTLAKNDAHNDMLYLSFNLHRLRKSGICLA